MAELISIPEAARLLEARSEFVRQMIAKGRLGLCDGERLDKAEVLELKALIGRLRGNGIAAMVTAVDDRPEE